MNTHQPRTKTEAHEDALAGDLSQHYTVAEQLDLIVIKSPDNNNGREAVARHNDVSVFVYPSNLTLHAGTHVRVKVSEIGDTWLKAVAIAVFD